MLATQYTYTITEDNGFHIILTQTSTGRTKKFFQVYGCKENLTKHMESLTDVQCADWFKGKG